MKLLTSPTAMANIDSHLQKTSDGISTPESSGQKAAIYAVFLCPSKIINAGLFRFKSVMVGCIGQPSGWPVPEAGSANPVQPASQRLAPIRGGYQPTSGETAMRNPIQNPPKTQGVKAVENPSILLTEELQLIEAAQIIGGIAESNCHFTAGLARRISETGKTVEELTVAELIALDTAHSEFYNKLFGGDS